MKQVFGIKSMLLLLVICGALGFVYQAHRADVEQLRSQFQQIEVAARNLELPVLNQLSATSGSDLQRAYIEYRLGLVAEQTSRPADMENAFTRSLTLLEKLSRSDSQAEIYALSAAIHLKQISRNSEPELHRAALDQALALGQQLDPQNPGLLLVAAKAMRQSANHEGTRTAMAELLEHEAGIQLDRYCSSACPDTESTFIWQGLAQALESSPGDTNPALLARCNSLNPMIHGS